MQLHLRHWYNRHQRTHGAQPCIWDRQHAVCSICKHGPVPDMFANELHRKLGDGIPAGAHVRIHAIARKPAHGLSSIKEIQDSNEPTNRNWMHRSMVPNHTQEARFNHQLFFRPSSQHSSHAPCHPRHNQVKFNAALMKPILSMKFSCLWVWSPTQNSHSFSLPID